MSLRPKKRDNAPVKKEPKIGRAALSRPVGPVPESSVLSRHNYALVLRRSKGFSFAEIGASGVTMVNAKRWGLPLDSRRRSVLDANVDALKGWAAKAREEKREGEMKKLEEELVKVEKEVKKGVAKVKKEAKKVEKEVEKVEKEVAERVEKKPAKERAKKKSSPKKKQRDSD